MATTTDTICLPLKEVRGLQTRFLFHPTLETIFLINPSTSISLPQLKA